MTGTHKDNRPAGDVDPTTKLFMLVSSFMMAARQDINPATDYGAIMEQTGACRLYPRLADDVSASVEEGQAINAIEDGIAQEILDLGPEGRMTEEKFTDIKTRMMAAYDIAAGSMVRKLGMFRTSKSFAPALRRPDAIRSLQDHGLANIERIAKYVGRVARDTEFNQRVIRRMPVIDMISIGLVDPDGNELYCVSSEFNLRAAKQNAWLAQNVIAQLPPKHTWLPRADIREEVLGFIGNAQVQFVDWVIPHDGIVLEHLLTQGEGMMNTEQLPENISRVSCNLAQTVLEHGVPRSILPSDDYLYKHTANADAAWLHRADNAVMQYLQAQKPL